MTALAHEHGSTDAKECSALIHLPLPPHSHRWKWSSGTSSESKQVAWFRISYMRRKASVLHPK